MTQTKPAPRDKRAAPTPVAAPVDAQRPDETPVDYMLRVMRDPKADKKRRDTMAKSATPFIHARPAPKKRRAGKSEESLKKRLEKARETLAGKIAQLRSDGDEGVPG
jgi:hypothetical protein